jgi:DNA-binding NarL/FixJ family response regulator
MRSPEMEAIRVVIVENHPSYARKLAAKLDDYPELAVVGVATTGIGALQVVERTEPDVVIIEFRLPDGIGPDTLRRLRRIRRVPALFLSGEDSAEVLEAAAWEAGASGYLLKSDTPETMHEVIGVAAKDELGRGRVQRSPKLTKPAGGLDLRGLPHGVE